MIYNGVDWIQMESDVVGVIGRYNNSVIAITLSDRGDWIVDKTPTSFTFDAAIEYATDIVKRKGGKKEIARQEIANFMMANRPKVEYVANTENKDGDM